MNSLNRIREHSPAAGPVVLSMLAGSLATSSPAAGIYRNGIGARAMSLGGADTTLAGSPLAALTANPAALGDFTSLSLELGLTAVFPAGEFNNVANTSASLRDSAAGFPDFSVVLPIATGSASAFQFRPMLCWPANGTTWTPRAASAARPATG